MLSKQDSRFLAHGKYVLKNSKTWRDRKTSWRCGVCTQTVIRTPGAQNANE